VQIKYFYGNYIQIYVFKSLKFFSETTVYVLTCREVTKRSYIRTIMLGSPKMLPFVTKDKSALVTLLSTKIVK
jgi:hypothetical protein